MGGQASPRGFVLLLVAASTVLLAWIVAPFAAALFAAAVLAGVVFPLQQALADRLGDRPAIAAAILTAGLALLAVGPLAGLCVFVAQQGAVLYGELRAAYRERGFDGLLDRLPEPLHEPARWLAERWPSAEPGPAGDAGGITDAQLATATDVVTAVLDGLAGVLVDLGVLLVALWFLLHRGRQLVDWIVGALPLPEDEGRRLVGEFRDVTRAVFGATVATAFVQTIVAALGYWLAGIAYLPIALLVTFVCALIPVVGAALVGAAGAGLLVLDGDTGWGVFLLVWGVGPVGVSDNVAKPWLAGGGMRLPGPVVLFAMLGGVAVCGPLGVVAGPLIVAFFLASLRLWHRGEPGEAGA